MSNHDGSYMLNHVFGLMERYEVFDLLGKEKSRELIQEIVKMSYDHDCNVGEILDGIGDRLGICYYCLNSATDLEDGICQDCLKRWESSTSGEA